MTDKSGKVQIKSSDITIPASGGIIANVKVGTGNTNGVICVVGRGVGDLLLEEVRAKIYRTEAQADAGSHTDQGVVKHTTLNGLDFTFDAVPNAQCKNSPDIDDNNWLVIWTIWNAGDPGKEKLQFEGQCSNATDCGS